MKTLFGLALVMSLLTAACAGSADAGNSMISTVYYKPIIDGKSECSSNDLKDMKDEQGARLVTLCEDDYSACLMQGSCLVLKKGKPVSYNYVGKKAGTFRFKETNIDKCPFGFGVRDSCLDPYFSVAADPSFYKFGDVIYVPALAGLKLPDGQTHDGYLIVRDTGGGIVGKNRFDFFTGYSYYLDKSNPFSRLGLADMDTRLPFSKATEAKATEIRKKRNFPGLLASVVELGHAMISSKDTTTTGANSVGAASTSASVASADEVGVKSAAASSEAPGANAGVSK